MHGGARTIDVRAGGGGQPSSTAGRSDLRQKRDRARSRDRGWATTPGAHARGGGDIRQRLRVRLRPPSRLGTEFEDRPPRPPEPRAEPLQLAHRLVGPHALHAEHARAHVDVEATVGERARDALFGLRGFLQRGAGHGVDGDEVPGRDRTVVFRDREATPDAPVANPDDRTVGR